MFKNLKVKMKNQVLIDIDTSRDKIVQIKKMDGFSVPTNQEEAKRMILSDISCVFEGLCTLINISDQNGYGNKNDLIKVCIDNLSQMMNHKENDGEL